MGAPGELPKIQWEMTKWVEEAPPKERVDRPAAKSPSEKGPTVVAPKPGSESAAPGKQAKQKPKMHLDVFDRAAATGKPVLLYFTAENCLPCRTMENLLLRQTNVVERTKGYHSVMLAKDFITEEIIKEFKVDSMPTVILVDAAGEKYVRLPGRQYPLDFSRTLATFAAQNARDVSKAKKASNAKSGSEKRPDQQNTQEKTGKKKDGAN